LEPSKNQLLVGKNVELGEEEKKHRAKELEWTYQYAGRDVSTEEAKAAIAEQAKEDVERKGTIVCGAPVGYDDFCTAYLEEKLCGEPMKALCAQVARIPDSQGLMYYVVKSMNTKATYLARVVSPHLYKPVARMFDRMIKYAALRHLATPEEKAPESLAAFMQEGGDEDEQCAGLPHMKSKSRALQVGVKIKHGGLGLVSAAETAEAAYVGSAELTLPSVYGRMPPGWKQGIDQLSRDEEDEASSPTSGQTQSGQGAPQPSQEGAGDQQGSRSDEQTAKEAEESFPMLVFDVELVDRVAGHVDDPRVKAGARYIRGHEVNGYLVTVLEATHTLDKAFKAEAELRKQQKTSWPTSPQRKPRRASSREDGEAAEATQPGPDSQPGVADGGEQQDNQEEQPEPPARKPALATREQWIRLAHHIKAVREQMRQEGAVREELGLREDEPIPEGHLPEEEGATVQQAMVFDFMCIKECALPLIP
jgi:hypothetical protein